MQDNVIVSKSFAFAVKIVKICHKIREDKKEYSLVDQLLRSGTSIGANVSEAVKAASKADFYAKMSIASKEASETEYWIRLFYETGLITKEQYDSVYGDCDEVLRILVAIVRSKNSKLN